MATNQSDILNANLDWLQKGKEEVFAEYKIADHKTIHDRIEKARRSTFDKSKFTMVGTPTITEDGILSKPTYTDRCISKENFIANTNDKITIKGAYLTGTEKDDTYGILYGLGSRDYGITLYSGTLASNNFFILHWYTDVNINYNELPFYPNSTYYYTITKQGKTVSILVENIEHNLSVSKSYTKVAEDTTAINSQIWFGGNGVLHGSILLKQLSLLLNDFEVFNGNKTGVDKVKEDDFTVVGNPIISEDGILKVDTSYNPRTNHIDSYSFAYNGEPFKFCARIKNKGDNPTSDVYMYYGFNFQINMLSSGEIRFLARTGKGSTYWDIYNQNIFTSVEAKKWCNIEFEYDGKDYILRTSTENDTPIELLRKSGFESFISGTQKITIGSTSTSGTLYTADIDLNNVKMYMNGNLVYQPTLRIPYTQASNGAKIVDATYRERVQDMYEQLSYTHYYTIGEEDYTIATREPYGLLQDGLKTKQDTISDIDTIRTNASSAKSTVDTHVANTTIHVTAQDKVAWSQKQNAIPDLEQIRTNAKTGADLAPQVATNTQRIEDLTTARIPDVIYHGTPKITGGQVTNFSTVNYLQFPFEDISRSLPFDIYFSFTTDDDVTTQQNIIDSHFGIALAIQNAKGVMALSSNGTNWDIGSVTGTNTILPNTTYYVKYSWTGTEYNASLSTNDQSYVPDMILQSNKSPYKTTIYIGGSEGLFGPNTAHPFKGIINFSKSRVVVNGITVWEGMADVGIASRANVSLNNLDEVGEKRFADKQDLIPDLTTIRDGASKGATALQSVPDEYITENELENRLNVLDTGLYYDPSKFTVVGTPTITEDGIASGFSISDYPAVSLSTYNEFEIILPALIMEDVTTTGSIEHSFLTTRISQSDASIFRIAQFSYANGNHGLIIATRPNLSSTTTISYILNKIPYSSKYLLKIKYNGTTLNIFYQLENTNEWVLGLSQDITFNQENILHFMLGSTRGGNDFCYKNKLDLKKLYVLQNGQQVFSGGKYLINDNNLDTTYIAKNTDLQQVKTDLATTDAIAKGAQQAVTFSNYQNAVTNINSYAYDKYNVGQNIMIETLDVPDLWVSAKFSDSQTYTYTTDDAIVNALKTDGHIRVGRYQLSALETGKVDLTNYVKFTDFATESKAGIIKPNKYQGSVTSDVDGSFVAEIKTLQQYQNNSGNNAFISKGTLENIKEDLVARAIQSSTFGLDIDLIEGAEQWL